LDHRVADAAQIVEGAVPRGSRGTREIFRGAAGRPPNFWRFHRVGDLLL